MKLVQGVTGFILCGVLITSCTNYFTWRREQAAEPEGAGTGAGTRRSADASTQTLCDIERTRDRMDVIKRLNLGKFREIAMKISKEVSSEDIASLKQMETARRTGGESSWEIGRRRSELISEIYNSAIMRSGIKSSNSYTIPGTGLSYTTGVDLMASGNESYVNIMIGHVKDPGEPGEISQISLSTNPDQSRYYVGLRRLTRVDTESDGTQVPVYSTLSLSDYADEMLPHYCFQVESALNREQFNTIPGLNSSDPWTQPSGLPAPSPIPSTSPDPTVSPSSSPSPIPAASAPPSPTASAAPVPSRTLPTPVGTPSAMP